MIRIVVGAGALCLAATAAFAQQVAPVTDVAAAIACAPKDTVAAVACLEKYLKPEAKTVITKAAKGDDLLTGNIYVGLWMRNSWGLWTGSPLSQFMLANKVTQPEAMSGRVVQAYWLKSKGCQFDLNNNGFLIAGINKANAGADPCTVTVAEAKTAGAVPMMGFAGTTSARPARVAASTTQTANADTDPDTPED